MSTFNGKPGFASGRPAVSVGSAQSARGPEFVSLVLRVPDPGHACDGARRNANSTFVAANAPALPLRDCGFANCRCSYERVANRRRSERRTKADRRDEIRFEMKGDRRSGKDRRKTNNVWHETH